jgi:hypothetical protein
MLNSGQICKALGVAAGLTVIVASTVMAQGAEEGGASAASPESSPGWTFDLSPYFFLSGVSGSITTANRTYPINATVSDLADNLRMGLWLSFKGSGRRWGFYSDLQYSSLVGKTQVAEDDEEPVLEVQLDNLIVEGDATLAIRDYSSLRFSAGIRVYYMTQELRFRTIPDEKVETTLVDPVFGARGDWDMGKKWRFALKGDIGGFGISSEFTYQLLMQFNWRFAKHWGLPFGYRLLSYTIATGGIMTDIRLAGLNLGVEYSF